MAVCGISTTRNVLLGLYFFLCGVEYAVILPTINEYLISLNANQTFLGIVLASFSAAGMIAGPIYGRISDRTKSPRACIAIGNMFEIIGNILYFMGMNMYLIWIGRVVCGLGSGAASCIFGLVSRNTTQTNRTSVLAALMSLRQIGLLIGPGLNAFLYNLNFKIGPFVVNGSSSPGLFMAILWFIHTIIFLIVFKNSEQTSDISSDESISTSNHVDNPQNINSSISSGIEGNVPEKITNKTFVKEFFREEVIICLAISFIAMFVQTGIETAITPLTLLYFEWTGLYNSYMLCGCGVIVVIGFGAVHFLGKRLYDRTVFFFGCLSSVVAYAVMFAFAFLIYKNQELETPSWVFPVFLIICLLVTISLPFLFVPHISLFSKITSEETQSFNQGVRLIAVRLGQIMGPLWASSTITTARLPIMSGVCLLILCILTGMVALSYKKLLPPPTFIKSNSSLDINADSSSESSPLLIKNAI